MAASTKAKRSAAAKKAARTRKKNKTKRSVAAKKAAHTRKRRKKKGVTPAVAKKAYAAGRGAEKKYAAILRKNNDQAHVGSGIPDILAHDRNGWKFYEIKPHMKRRGYSKNGSWQTAGEKSRLLNEHQMSVFRQLVSKREDVNMVYYYRKRCGSKTKPRYMYKYREIKLRKSHFKSSKGPDPEKMSPIPEDIQRWMEKRIV